MNPLLPYNSPWGFFLKLVQLQYAAAWESRTLCNTSDIYVFTEAMARKIMTSMQSSMNTTHLSNTHIWSQIQLVMELDISTDFTKHSVDIKPEM